jgi:hypothetical protein
MKETKIDSSETRTSRQEYFKHLLHMGSDIHNRPFQENWNLWATSVDQTQLHIYSCLQSLMKMHEVFDEVIAQVGSSIS